MDPGDGAAAGRRRLSVGRMRSWSRGLDGDWESESLVWRIGAPEGAPPWNIVDVTRWDILE